MAKITVEFWQGSVKDTRTYEGDTFNEALILADNDIFSAYYASPPMNMFMEMLDDLEDGKTHRNWSWFTVTPAETEAERASNGDIEDYRDFYLERGVELERE